MADYQGRLIHDGGSIDYTPSAAVSAGDVIVQGTLVGIAKLDIAAAALGALAVTGVFDMAKVTGAITAGAKVYWDADGDPLGGTAGSGCITTVVTSNTYVGKCVQAAASTDTVCAVRLEQ